MTDITDDKKLSYAEKIAKLLRKAESASTSEEAEECTRLATKIQQKYAVSEQLLASIRGVTESDEVVADEIFYSGVFAPALYDIGKAVAQAHDCKILITKVAYKYDPETRKRTKGTILHLVGFKSDIAKVKVLDSSVQIQAVTQLNRWWKSSDATAGCWSAMDKFKARRTFLFGFAQGLQYKLLEAKRAGTEEAVVEHAAATGQDEATVRTGTELVLRNRKEQVNDWYDKTYGRSTRSVSRSYASGGSGARAAGYAAGRTASTNQRGVGGSRGAIGGR